MEFQNSVYPAGEGLQNLTFPGRLGPDRQPLRVPLLSLPGNYLPLLSMSSQADVCIVSVPCISLWYVQVASDDVDPEAVYKFTGRSVNFSLVLNV